MIFDKDFENDFNGYFKSNIFDVDEYLEKHWSKEAVSSSSNHNTVTTIVNYIKTAKVIGTSYEVLLEEIKRQTLLFGLSPKTKLICALVAKLLEATVIKRDVYRESAATVFKVKPEQVTDDMKEKVKGMGFDDSYSVQDEPVNSWDEYYFNVCRQTARNSKCLSRRIGAILVKDKIIISTGYNGPPRGIPDCDKRWTVDPIFKNKYEKDIVKETEGKCPRYAIGCKSGEQMEICVAAHAEENCILSAARLGTSVKGSTMYMTCFTGDTEVVTYNGLVPIKNINIDDYVLSKNGKFNKVLDKHVRSYSGDIIDISPKGLELFSFKVTPNHKLFGKKAEVCHYNDSNNRSCFLCDKNTCLKNVSNTIYEEIKACNITDTDYLYIPTLLEHHVENFDYRSKEKRHLRRDIPDELFNDKNYPWIVGMFIAEGSVNKVKNNKYYSSVVFSLHKKEVYYSNRVKNFFEKFGFSVYIKDKDNKKVVIIHSSELAKHFALLCGEGAQNKKIDKGLLFSDKILEVIDGVWCGDGTNIKNQKSIKTVSLTLAKQLSLLLLLHKFNVKVYTEDEKIDKNGVKHKKSYTIVYFESGKNQVNRKSDFVKVGNVSLTTVKNINVFDLSIENDSSYSVGPISVHNCGIPCTKCLIKIINSGVAELVVTTLNTYDESSLYLLHNSDVKVRFYDFIK